MTDDVSKTPERASVDAAQVPHGAVIVGVVPGQSPRVLTEAARYAGLLSAPLALVHVDVTRFVTFEDPDGYVHVPSADAETSVRAAEMAEVRRVADEALASTTVSWSVHELVGDPALAIKHLAERIDAPLLVVGTRNRGFGESLREFFAGSVAVRLSRRQHRPLLVVPLGDAVPDDQEVAWE